MLKSNGFKNFSGRTYWKYHNDRIDIINFQSFNSYNADVIGCTTYSFAVNLACFLLYIPSQTKIKTKNEKLRPEEYEAHFRAGITKGIYQKELQQKDIWFADDKGTNLSIIVNDCKKQIEQIGFQWFNQFECKDNVLDILLSQELDMEKLFGFGNMDSPCRNRLIAYTAMELNKVDLAITYFERLLDFNKKEYKKEQYTHYQNEISKIEEKILSLKTIKENNN